MHILLVVCCILSAIVAAAGLYFAHLANPFKIHWKFSAIFGFFSLVCLVSAIVSWPNRAIHQNQDTSTVDSVMMPTGRLAIKLSAIPVGETVYTEPWVLWLTNGKKAYLNLELNWARIEPKPFSPEAIEIKRTSTGYTVRLRGNYRWTPNDIDDPDPKTLQMRMQGRKDWTPIESIIDSRF